MSKSVRVFNDNRDDLCNYILELEAQVERLTAAIRWALGETDDFPPRQPGQGAYWWRTELQKRAALAHPTPEAQPKLASHVCAVMFLPDGSIGCPRCSGFEPTPEAQG